MLSIQDENETLDKMIIANLVIIAFILCQSLHLVDASLPLLIFPEIRLC